jgi:hypothetical protein
LGTVAPIYTTVDTEYRSCGAASGTNLTGGHLDNIRTGLEYTADPITGILALGAPAFADEVFAATFYWNWFADTDYYNFLHNAGRMVGLTPAASGTDTTMAQAVLDLVDDGLMPAIKKYAEHLQWGKRSSTWASRFGSTFAASNTQGIGDVSNKFAQLAKQAKIDGDDLLMKFRMGGSAFGSERTAAGGVVRFRGTDVSRPKR